MIKSGLTTLVKLHDDTTASCFTEMATRSGIIKTLWYDFAYKREYIPPSISKHLPTIHKLNYIQPKDYLQNLIKHGINPHNVSTKEPYVQAFRGEEVQIVVMQRYTNFDAVDWTHYEYCAVHEVVQSFKDSLPSQLSCMVTTDFGSSNLCYDSENNLILLDPVWGGA